MSKSVGIHRLDAGVRSRLTQLDGLRGVAALVVVLNHFMCAFAPRFVPELTSVPAPITNTPFNLIWNGAFAVSIFFVLSGFVIFGSAVTRPESLLIRLPLRYARLAIPATSSIIWAFFLLKLFPHATTELSSLHPSNWTLATYRGGLPSFRYALWTGLFRVFVYGGTNFNNPLWTMRIELLGSAGLYILTNIITEKWVTRSLCCIAVLLPLAGLTPYEGFALGALLFQAKSSGKLILSHPLLVLLTGLLLGFLPIGISDRLHLPHLTTIFTPGEKNSIYYPIGAAMMIAAILVSEQLAIPFETVAAQFLGRISFALYLFHAPFLVTVFTMLYVMGIPNHAWPLAFLCALFLAASVVIGFLATIAIDEPTIRLLSRAKKYFRRSHEIVPDRG